MAKSSQSHKLQTHSFSSDGGVAPVHKLVIPDAAGTTSTFSAYADALNTYLYNVQVLVTYGTEYLFTCENLPPGLVMTTAGQLQGQATVPGVYECRIFWIKKGLFSVPTNKFTITIT